MSKEMYIRDPRYDELIRFPSGLTVKSVKVEKSNPADRSHQYTQAIITLLGKGGHLIHRGLAGDVDTEHKVYGMRVESRALVHVVLEVVE